MKRRAVDKDERHEIEYTDEVTEAFAANTIAENLLAQVGDQGQRILMINEIEDCRKTADAVPREKGTIRTTKGWDFT